MEKIKNQDLLKLTDILVKSMSEKYQNEFCSTLARLVKVPEVDIKDLYTHLKNVNKNDFIGLTKLLMNSKYTSDPKEAFRRFREIFKSEYSVK